MELHTNRLLLRPLTLNDLDTKHDYAKDEVSNQYMLFLPKLRIEETLLSLQNAVYNWENNNPDNYEFAIVFEDKHIGEIGLYRLNSDEAELGWVLHKDYQNKGFVTEAAFEILTLAKRINFKKVVAHCDERNLPSRRVMEKLGMIENEHKGVRKNRIASEESVELLYEIRI
ncbi:GNAT family N-acetyltransferase [Acholeplasma hippikon]|nr:GNAT family N-acetyltransferase [Acholeplasma hippikon]